MGIINVQFCNDCQSLSNLECKFQSLTTIFHQIIFRMQNIPIMNELKVSQNDNICKLLYIYRSIITKVTIVT